MRKILLVSLLLAGCVDTGPQSVLIKPGTLEGQRNYDSTSCEVFALKQVPTAMAVATNPAYTTPVSTQCYGFGNSASCYQTGGQTYGGNTYSYDANLQLRSKVWGQCMAAKGYGAVTIPRCSKEQAARAVSSASVKQPQPSSIECVVDGGFVIKK